MLAAAPYQVFERSRDLRADEMFGGHINFSHFFRYVGEAFHEWYPAMGIGIDRDHTQGGPVMASMTLDFLDELFHPGQVRACLTVTRVGRSSLEHQIELFNVGKGSLCARGRSIHVWKKHHDGQECTLAQRRCRALLGRRRESIA